MFRGEVEEFFGHFGGDGVVAEVAGGDFAVACAEVAGYGGGGVEGEGLFKDWKCGVSMVCDWSVLRVSPLRDLDIVRGS